MKMSGAQILQTDQFNIARRELMLVTHHPEGPRCLETFAHSFFDEFFFVVRIYEIN